MLQNFFKSLLVLLLVSAPLESCSTPQPISPNSNQLLSQEELFNGEKQQNKNTTEQDNPSDFPILPSSPNLPENYSSQNPQMIINNGSEGWNKNLLVDDVPYDLYIPPNYNQTSKHSFPSLLVLPGWDYKRTSWIDNTNLVKYADQYGYALILPEMGKTLYESEYYPETKMKWNSIPGGKFIKERFIPEIQKRHNLLKPGQHNTTLGLSTGGRGVVLIALENPGLFVAGASLSGDFSQDNMPSDRLMTSVYGAFAQFPDRWKGRDNPQKRVDEWKMPLYLAHGTGDRIVPESQSRLFYDALVRHHNGNILVQYNAVQGAGHDYQFWGGQLENVFEFIDKDWN